VELPRPKVTQNYRMPRKRPSGLDWVTEGSEVQVEDPRGHWYLATVEEVDDDESPSSIYVSYSGWPEKAAGAAHSCRT